MFRVLSFSLSSNLVRFGFDGNAIQAYYDNTMIQTSVSLPEDVAMELARLEPSASRRSEIIAKALRAYFKLKPQPQSDIEILNGYADELNTEAEDVLEFQRIP